MIMFQLRLLFMNRRMHRSECWMLHRSLFGDVVEISLLLDLFSGVIEIVLA